MNVSELLADLEQQGVRVWANQDRLGVRSTKGALTSDLRATLTEKKAEILAFLHQENAIASPDSCDRAAIGLATIGRLIGGFKPEDSTAYRLPVTDPLVMARQLRVTFRPLPKQYDCQTILEFRNELEAIFKRYGVTVEPWQQATKPFRYDITVPFLKWKYTIETQLVKAQINAVIDVERPLSAIAKIKRFLAERLYQFLCRWVWRDRKPSIPRIVKAIGWAEDSAAKYVENPTNTQVITLTDLDWHFVSAEVPYNRKIGIGINALIRTFSEIIIGVSADRISILNMNLSDSLFQREALGRFVLKSLIPKIFVPIVPLPLSRFEIGSYDPHASLYAAKLVALGNQLAATHLFPPGFKLGEAIERQSYRDIVEIVINGRTGVSYGFVAYAEPPQYVGKIELDPSEWETLFPVAGFDPEEVRQNELGRRYLKVRIKTETKIKQIPDIWLVSSRSGANKTNLDLTSDVTRIGLRENLILQLPQGKARANSDIKPSYDTYVMVAIALSCALFTPELMQAGLPIVHFHGYPAKDWFDTNEYYFGTQNPSVPCGTYESGVFNFLGIKAIAERAEREIALMALIEPDHGTNIIASTTERLVSRLKTGTNLEAVELGGKHFASLQGKTESALGQPH